MTRDQIEESEEFREAWRLHVEGNSFYDLDSMSQPEIDAFRFAFLSGYVAGCEPTNAVICQLRMRCDGVLRKIIIGTAILCSAAIIGAWLWQQLR